MMIRTYLVPLLAIAGVVLAVVTVVKGSRPPVPTPPMVEPPRAPFDSFVAGSGLLEASSQNIAIGTPVAGVAAVIAVRVGQDVKAGEELFRIDGRELSAELSAREAALRVAEAQLAKLRLGTRPEEMPQMRARVEEARSLLDDAAAQLSMWQNVSDKRAVSEDELTRRRFAVESARARLDQARADLALKEAGSWSADIAANKAVLYRDAAVVRQFEDFFAAAIAAASHGAGAPPSPA
jgi:multidrug efflux pump subunit AcrA (membrane-fusion protein)